MGKFRYFIQGNSTALSGTVNAPDGWKDDESTFDRSGDYKGIFRKFSANELTFKQNGATLLRNIFAQNSFESEAKYIVYETDFDGGYVEFQRFLGESDFVEYTDTDGNDGGEVTIKVIDSSFWSTIRNRDNIKPQLSQLLSLDGAQIVGFTNEEIFLTLLAVPDTLNAGLSVNNSAQLQNNHALPLTKNSGDDDNATTVHSSTLANSINNAFYIVSTSVFSLVVNVVYTTTFDLQFNGTTVDLKLKHYNSLGVQQNSGTDVLATINGNAGDSVILNYFGDTNFVPDVDDYFILSVESNLDIENQIPYSADVNTAAAVDEIPDVQISGQLAHETLSRILQLYTGKTKPLYSELLGRENSEPRSYASSGELSELLITNGERLRGFTKAESPITLSWKDAFNSFNSIMPIGICEEIIDGEKTIRLEKRKYFFDDRVVLTFDNASNITQSVLTDKVFNKITVGYNKAEYEIRKGLNEFNQKSEFSTPISVIQNELKIVSPIRADNNAIMGARRKPKSQFPTEDTKFDLDNYFIKVIQNSSDLLNGNFENWINDNTPEDWIVSAGTMLRKNLLGSDRCYFESAIATNAIIDQTFAVISGAKFGVGLSYENIGVSAVNGYMLVSVDDGADTYHVDSTGTWFKNFQKTIFFTAGLLPTAETELQSFLSFYLNADTVPVSGTMQVKILGNPGLIIDDVVAGVTQYIAKTTEGYTSVKFTPYGESSLNLDIIPGRNIRNHGSEIRAGQENHLSQLIKFNTSDKNSTTETQKATETSPVVENADIVVNELSEPYLKPIQWEFDEVIDKDVIDVLNDTFAGETKPKYLGMIKFRMKSTDNYRYGWLVNLGTGGESKLGKISVVEVNTDYISPVEI